MIRYMYTSYFSESELCLRLLCQVWPVQSCGYPSRTCTNYITMSDDLVYIIPPYLLHTCVGLELHRELTRLDPELGARNFFSPESAYIRQPTHLPSRSNTFCDDPAVNAIIRDKLKDKFAVLGILGDVPSDDVPDDYLYELYEIFKYRLSLGASHLDSDLASVAHTPRLLATAKEPAKSKRSVFELPKLGEFVNGPGFKKSQLSTLANCSLDTLMAWARDSDEHKYSFFPYLMVDGKKSFLSPLPMYWTPLSVDKHLELLDKTLGMEVAFENGYSVLKFRLQRGEPGDDTPRKKRFYNFISNNEVEEKMGIFYYEVLVEQTATQSTDFRPIIHANDSSLSSTSSLFFSMGYTKRNVRFDRLPSGTGSATSNVQSVDLKAIQSDLLFYDQEAYGSKIDSDTLTFLGAEPGISFEGSLAVSFNNSCSYASIKNNDNNYRTSALSMNRRFSQLNRQAPGDQETSKLDIEVPFNMHSLFHDHDISVSRTDTVGFGVNFIEQTLFVTLNGILVKTITNKEIVSSNKYKDSIFDLNSKMGSLYPMIGFQLSDLPSELGAGVPPESKIITNFGIKEFKFNINNYVKNLKARQDLQLQAAVEEELRNTPASDSAEDAELVQFEKSVRNIKDDPSMLTELIKGYLIQEGYLETLGAFETDLVDLAKNTLLNGDASDQGSTIESLVSRSHGENRAKLRSLVMKRQFLDALDFLKLNYPKLERYSECAFELKLMYYIDLLEQFVALKFKDEPAAKSSGPSQEEIFEKAVNTGRDLLEATKLKPEIQHALGELSSVLLMNSIEELNELPMAKRYIESLPREVANLANHLNVAILEANNFERESRLESMVHSVGRNISDLCGENDDEFKLINYERDYIDV